MIADFIGSTAALLEYTKKDDSNVYIIATEAGIIHQMKKANPEKTFIAAPPRDSTCGCSECNFMKLITIEKIYKCLLNEDPQIFINEGLMDQARIPIKRMLDMSSKLNI